MKRRKFITNTAKGLTAAMVFPQILSSCKDDNDMVNVGFLGVGGRGSTHLKKFISIKGVNITGIYDPFKDRKDKWVSWVNNIYEKYNSGKKSIFKFKPCKGFDDFRALLNDDSIDAVVISTPDHWHVPLSVYAIDRGKDVYVEKPLGLTIEQGQILRKKVHDKKAVLQYGTQQRSGRHFWLAAELTRRGKIGKLERIDAWCPGRGRTINGSTKPIPVPPGFSYDTWLGPAKVTPYTKDRCTNEGAWFVYDNSIGFLGGWGAHPLDIAQWGNRSDNTGPVRYSGSGSYFPKGGLFDTIDKWDIHCEYANGVKMHFFSNDYIPDYVKGKRTNIINHGTTFWGTDGWVSVDRQGIYAGDPDLLKFKVEPGQEECYVSTDHQANFIECVRSRKQPVSNIDAAVRSDTISHLCDILIRSGAEELLWDPVSEKIINPGVEMEPLMHRHQRKPYDFI